MVGAAIGEGTELDGAWQEGTGANGAVVGGQGDLGCLHGSSHKMISDIKGKSFFFLIISYKILISKLDSQ